MGFQFQKMEKNTCSSPSRAPKSQLAVEQLAVDRRMLNLLKTDTSCPKTKKKPQQDSRRGTIMIKSNPIPPRWMAHRLKNSNTKEVLPLF